jgi:hypothetical protein
MAMSSVVKVKSASEQALTLIQREYPNYHPLIALARLAHDPLVIADPKLEVDIHKSILPYVAPKLSSVEVKQEATDDRRVIVSLFETHVLENGRTVDVEVPLITEVSELVPLDR